MEIYKYLRENKICLLVLLCLVVLASILRYVYVAGTNLSEFDPWRHLQLLKNIRNGVGFTLFDGQPYIWYNEIWYYLAGMFVAAEKVQWVSCWISALSVVLFFLFLLRTEKSLTPAVAGGLMMAAFGPMIAFTCTYGSESFALFLMLFSFLLSTYRTRFSTLFVSGIFFGLALVSRINFLFNCIILIPILKNRRNCLIFFSGVTAILLFAWWRNYLVISHHAYLFTWDGLATKREGYGALSTLIPQLHPAVAEATRALYKQIAPIPSYLYYRGQIAWGTIFFMTLGVVCILISKRLSLMIAGLLPLVYFTFFDKTLSTNFFRHYLAIFPPFFIGIAVAADRIGQNKRILLGHFSFICLALVGAVILSGIRYMKPQPMIRLEHVTPPPTLLTKEYYMVNSGFYHPESLVYRYPDKKFIGMPLDPGEFDEFLHYYPKYTSIIWHLEFSVQDELLRYLTDSGKYRVVNAARNKGGVQYLLLEAED